MDARHISNIQGRKCADRLIAELATRQHGVVALAELLALGISERQIQHRVETGRLHRIYAGVFAVGYPLLSAAGRCMAATAAAGSEAALSHRAAVWNWGLPQQLPARVDVICPRRRRSRAGLRCHVSRIPADELAVHRNIPTTIPSRSILDVAPVTEIHRLERMIEVAEHRTLHSPVSYVELLRRYKGRPGTPKLRTILGLRAEPAWTRSEWEARALSFCDRHRIRRPRTSYIFHCFERDYELDAFWPELMLALEFDSWEFHGGRQAFREDRIRDRALTRAGVRTIRITVYDLTTGSRRLADDLRALTAGAAEGPIPAAPVFRRPASPSPPGGDA